MRGAVALALGLLAAGSAMAQPAALQTSAALECMTPPAAQRGAPEYPFLAFKKQLSGQVKVRLKFTGQDIAPAVTVLANDGDDSFVDAVRAHVRNLRVPCLAANAEPVELDFSYVFRPDEPEPVTPAVPLDPRAAALQRQRQCVQHVSGRNMPDYPLQALRSAAQGRVLAELRFEAPDKPPVAVLLPRKGGDAVEQGRHATQPFLDMLRDWVQGYRMPCLEGAPVTVEESYVFVIEGSAFGFKPGITLRELLPLVRNIRLQRLQFDFNQMACPFDVALTYWQPNRPNVVRVRGAYNAAREPFLDWLRQSHLDMPASALDTVYGDTAMFTVPCLKIDLNPDQKE